MMYVFILIYVYLFTNDYFFHIFLIICAYTHNNYKMKYDKRKQNTTDDVLSMIQQSLRKCDSSKTDRSGYFSLPGFDNEFSCNFCKLRLHNDNRIRITRNGMSFVDFLSYAQKQFDQDEGRPSMDIVNEIKNGLNKYIEANEKLSGLRGISNTEIYRHFKFGHTQDKTVRIKERVIRILVNMLDVCVQSMCENVDGKTVLNKNDSSLALHIIDTLVKVHRKDNIQ